MNYGPWCRSLLWIESDWERHWAQPQRCCTSRSLNGHWSGWRIVCRLLQVRGVAVRVVEEGKTQPKILAAELRWQRRERSRRCNSAISRTVKRHISGAVYVTKSGDLTVFQNCELD